MKNWPDNPNDAKELHISVVGGLIVSIVMLTKDVMQVTFTDANQNIMLAGLYIILWVMLFIFLNRYMKIREKLDELHLSRKS